LGLSERKAVWILWILSALGAAAGLLTEALPFGVLAIAALLLIGTVVFGVFLHFAHNAILLLPYSFKWLRRRIPPCVPSHELVDTLLSAIALFAAFLIRWEGVFVGVQLHQFLVSLPIFMTFHALGSIGLRTFNSGWRWFGVRDLSALAICTFFSSATSIFVLMLLGMRDYSRGTLCFIYSNAFLYIRIEIVDAHPLAEAGIAGWYEKGSNLGSQRRFRIDCIGDATMPNNECVTDCYR
jgi:hypothetical protein